MNDPLRSLNEYSRYIAESFSQTNVKSSTVAVWSDSPYTGVAEGEVVFVNGLRLRMREEVDFDAGISFHMVMKCTGVKSGCIGTMISRTPTIRLWLRLSHITNIFRLTSNIIEFPRPG